MDKIKPTREEILETINKIIKDECYKINGCFFELTEESLLNNAGLDSFGYILFWMNISQDYKIVKETGNEEIDNKASIDYVNWIDYKVYTVKDLIDRIEKCM